MTDNRILNQTIIRQYWRQEMASARNQQPGRLLAFGHKAYSQNDEDGILQEIFRRIGTNTQRFIEFGVGNGLQCNTLLLLMQGWSGGWMESKPEHIASIQATHKSYIDSGQLRVLQTLVTTETINENLASLSPDQDLDLLSIDVDYHDYWIWQAVTRFDPRVVVIEYNATWPPPLSVTVPNTPGASWNGTNHFGASLEALTKLGKEKGYHLVGCCFAGVNAFFVREDLCANHFHAPGDAAEHYEPAPYFMLPWSSGHPAGVGPLVTV